MATVKKSAIIAFIELLRSIDAEDDVVLLRSSDCYAKEALHTCNGDTFDVHLAGHDPAYAAFINKLTQNFEAMPVEEGVPPQVNIPDKHNLIFHEFLRQIKSGQSINPPSCCFEIR